MTAPKTDHLLFAAFLRRDIRNRFAGSLLGVVWALLQPLALLLIYGFVFTLVFKVRVGASGSQQPFLVFLSLALWPWMAFSEGVLRGSGAVVAHAALITKVRFRHAIVVIAAVTGAFVVHGAGYLVVLTLLLLNGQDIHLAGLPLALLMLGGLYVLALGLALALSAMHVFVRDVEQFLQPALNMLFYLCPILYAASAVPEALQAVVAGNPLAQLIEGVRDAWSSGRWWPTGTELAALAGCAVVWWLGRWMFDRLSPHFEEAL